MPSESELIDLVAAALRGDDQWDSLSESQKSVWRADADRAIKALRNAGFFAVAKPAQEGQGS